MRLSRVDRGSRRIEGADSFARSNSSRSRLLLAVTAGAIVAAAAFLVVGGGRHVDRSALPTFVSGALGAPRRVTPRVDGGGFHARVSRNGFTVSTAAGSASLSTPGRAGRPWRRYRGGVTRLTGYGRETIALAPGQAEQFQTVVRRQ